MNSTQVSARNISIKRLNTPSTADIIAVQKDDGFEHAYYLTDERIQRLMHRGEFATFALTPFTNQFVQELVTDLARMVQTVLI